MTEDDQDNVDSDVSPEEARRQAAEAAMRRFGLLPDAAVNGSSSSPSVTAVPLSGAKLPANEAVTNAIDYKGKGKAKAEESWDDPPTFMPFLSTPSLDPVFPRVPRETTPLSSAFGNLNGLSSPPWSAGSRRDGQAGAPALEERLQALRQVDDVIWGLVGELTMLKSRWEAVDESISSPMAMGQSQKPPDSDPPPAGAMNGTIPLERVDGGPVEKDT